MDARTLDAMSLPRTLKQALEIACCSLMIIVTIHHWHRRIMTYQLEKKRRKKLMLFVCVYGWCSG